MVEEFKELGLRDEIVQALETAGFEAPTPLQRAVIPVLRRGGSALIHGSSGAGITAAYALPLLDRFAGESGTRGVVIVPTDERADQVARTFALLGKALDVSANALAQGWPRNVEAHIVAGTPLRILHVIENSELKLDAVEAIVVEQVSTILSMGGAATLETLFTSLPREGQRVLISTSLNNAVEKLAEAHARRALRFPPRSAIADEAPKAKPTDTIRYLVAAPPRKVERLATLLTDTGARSVLCRTQQTAAHVRSELAMRGINAGVTTYDEASENSGVRTIAFDVPFSVEQFQRALANDDVLLCAPRELPHARNLADEANVRLAAWRDSERGHSTLDAFRDEIRRAAREEDIEAELLVLEPLFDELAPAEVAAAAAALLRARRPIKAEQPGARAGTKTWSRLFLSVGERDGARAGDIVGAITGEAAVKGEDVGRVEIRDTFSVVEVASTVADRVIRSLNGTTMKNRSLRVDYDRKTAPSGRGKGPGGPRRAPAGRPPRAGPPRRSR